ncbi:MAG: hypothetical protein NTY53_01515 [Kiritimatiellaeota bacterium]|nr:hypothetical protein [Kiritimatiellota bacterium]
MKTSSKLLIAGGLVLALGVGLVVGFIGGVLATKTGRAIFTSLLESERPAQVARPRVLAREQFQLQYPANWKLNREDKDFDPDHAFNIESPGSAFIMFHIGQAALDPEETLRDQIAAFSKLMDRPVSTRFTQWGGFTGQGAVLRGRVLGIATTIKPFVFNQNGLSVIVVQHYPDEDQQAVLPGLKLVEHSFTVTPVHPQKTEP